MAKRLEATIESLKPVIRFHWEKSRLRKKTDLCKETGLSNSTVAKMTRGDDVLVSVLTRICKALDCNIGDIVDVECGDKRIKSRIRRR